MKILYGVIGFLSILFFGYSHPPLETINDLDIDRYMGNWHQIAAIPAAFQKKCVSDVQAEYRRLSDTHIEVVNSCVQANGETKYAFGRARVNCDFNIASRLQVTFVKFISWWLWAFGGDYWVIELGDHYEYSVVGEQSREYLWILSREPEMDQETLIELGQKIFDHGYDTCKIYITAGEFSGVQLCTLMNNDHQ